MSRYVNYLIHSLINYSEDVCTISRKLKNPAEKRTFSEKFVDKLLYSDVRKESIWPKTEIDIDTIYQITNDLLEHRSLQRYVAIAIINISHNESSAAIDLISAINSRSKNNTVAIITHLDVKSSDQSIVKTTQALRELLDAASKTVWLDAANTIRKRKALYQLTKWPEILETLPQRERGQFFEEELGL